MWTTPSDLCTFALAVRAAYAGADGALLSPALGREMLTPQIRASERLGGLDHLGLGMFLGGERFGHSGGNEGFKCHLLVDRESGYSAAVMTKGENGMWVVQRAFAALASAYGWSGYDEPLDGGTLPAKRCSTGWWGGTGCVTGSASRVGRSGAGVDVTFDGQGPMGFAPMGGDAFGSSMVGARLRIGRGGLLFEQNGAQLTCAWIG